MTGTLPDAPLAAVSPVAAGYRPALDGVRGVAILLVLVDHIGHESRWHVGHHGVTLFFALSGYLITGLLLDEIARDGSVSLTRFYLRRAARLLPALLLVVVVCDALFLLLGNIDAIEASIAAVFYAANYATILEGDYLPGYGHTWSLAVEEHFYAIWPVALMVMVSRLGTRSALRWTLVACGAAFAWRAALLTFDEYPAQWLVINHGTFARADALLYGCAVAIAVRLGWRPRSWMAWAAPVTIAVLVVADPPDDVTATVGQAALAVAGAVLLACVDYTATPLARVLAVRPLVWLGTISYGLYLWHYPLLYVAHGAGFEGPLARVVSGGLLAVAVSAASYSWLEQPVRRAVRAREAHLVRWREQRRAPAT